MVLRVLALLVVVGALVGGFYIAGGSLAMLVHPAEIIVILGMALGGWLAMVDKHLFSDTLRLFKLYFSGLDHKGMIHQIADFSEEMMEIRRKDGPLAVEKALQRYERDSSAFKQAYSDIAACPLIKKCLFDVMEVYMSAGAEEAAQFAAKLVAARKKDFSSRYERVVASLERVADWLPGFGIVAAVLGVILAMGLLGEGVDIASIGKAIGIALTGTLLGVFAAFGIVSPLVAGMYARFKSIEAVFDSISEFIMLYHNASNPKFTARYIHLLDGDQSDSYIR